MEKELKFICAQPDDTYYTWQVHMWLESLKERGQVHNAIVLVFTPKVRNFNDKWQKIQDLYPEAEFNFYKDEEGEISQLISIYIPVLRPWLLWKYWSDKPEMKDHAIFYCDSDIWFTEKFNIDDFIEDLLQKSYIQPKRDGTGNGDGMSLTPKTEKLLREHALRQIFGKLKKSTSGNHKTKKMGQGEDNNGEFKAYQFGDALEKIDMTQSIKNAQIR